VHAHNGVNQKFRKSEISLDTGFGCSRENLTPDPVGCSRSPNPKCSPCTPLVHSRV